LRRIGGSFDFVPVQYNTIQYGAVRYGTSQTLHPKPYIKIDDNVDIIDEYHVDVVNVNVNDVVDDVSD